MNNNDFEFCKYEQACEDIANEALSLHGEDWAAAEEYIREAVDTSRWIIYTAGVVCICENSNADIDEGNIEPSRDWRELMTQTAYWLMFADCQREYERLQRYGQQRIGARISENNQSR